MTTPISLEQRVAVITGAGRGLGLAHAMALAARGAAVVVNDLGTDGDGKGSDPAVAQAAADRIRAAGGRAVANNADISTKEGGQAVVDLALREFGRIDIVVNNAGICGHLPFMETEWSDYDHYMRIHLAGHVHVTKAALPHLIAQKWGRIIMTESASGLYGLDGQSTYSAAKGAIHGLMRVLALEMRDHGILVNSVTPGGFSRMAIAALPEGEMLDWMRSFMPAELVSPLIVWLSSDACQVTGQVYSAWSGRVARVAMGNGTGFFDRAITPEAIASNHARVASLDGFYEPVTATDEISHWLEGEGRLLAPKAD